MPFTFRHYYKLSFFDFYQTFIGIKVEITFNHIKEFIGLLVNVKIQRSILYIGNTQDMIVQTSYFIICIQLLKIIGCFYKINFVQHDIAPISPKI